MNIHVIDPNLPSQFNWDEYRKCWINIIALSFGIPIAYLEDIRETKNEENKKATYSKSGG